VAACRQGGNEKGATRPGDCSLEAGLWLQAYMVRARMRRGGGEVNGVRCSTGVWVPFYRVERGMGGSELLATTVIGTFMAAITGSEGGANYGSYSSGTRKHFFSCDT
jgi:hypothetical protein